MAILTIDIDSRYDRPVAKISDLLPGTLDLLILRTLELAPRHGVAIADRIAQLTGGVVQVGPGSLFPALHRLTEKGWIEGAWTESEAGRRVKSYTLTASGRDQLAEEKRNWNTIFGAMNRALAEEAE
jgi:PadR family transcriptional regulator PadR